MKITRLLLLLVFLVPAKFMHGQVYTTTSVITGLDNPVAFDFLPDNRIILTQKGGSSGMATDAQLKMYNANFTYAGLFYDLTDSTYADFERGLLGVAVDPDFTNNHFIYCYYNHLYNGSQRIRIARFTEVNNVGTNPQIVFDLDITSYNIAGNHVAGNLHFRPSDPNNIYFTIGDLAYHQTSAGNYAQMLTKPFGKVLRIGKNPVPAGSNVHAVNGFSCNVPTDNPFYDDGNPSTGNCDIIWSYGHRNPFDFCFNPTTDSMYVSENGLNTWDEVNQIHKGGNYGWNTCEGRMLNSSTSSPCNLAGSILPMEVWASPLPALTGILFYTSATMPEFDNHLLVTDNDYARIYDLALTNAPAYDSMLTRTQWQDLAGGHTTMKQGPEGCIYVMKGGYDAAGAVKRICPQGLGTQDYINPYFSLTQTDPNPFSVSTTIKYTMKQNAAVRVALYDIYGKEVAVLTDGTQAAGAHTLEVNAANLNLAPGMYFCNMESGTYEQSLKLTVTK